MSSKATTPQTQNYTTLKKHHRHKHEVNKHGERIIALDMSKILDTVTIHSPTHKLHKTYIPHTILKCMANYINGRHACIIHSETKYKHNAKLVCHKTAFYHPHYSTLTIIHIITLSLLHTHKSYIFNCTKITTNLNDLYLWTNPVMVGQLLDKL